MGCNQSVEVIPGGTRPNDQNASDTLTADHHEPLHQMPEEDEVLTDRIHLGDTADPELHDDDYNKDYRIVKKVPTGKSSLSSIYMVLKKKSPQNPSGLREGEQKVDDDENVYVLQVINMKLVAPERRKSMRKEIISLQEIHHPNILRVHAVYDAIKRNNTIATVTELCTGSHLHSTVPYPESRAKRIVSQILDALHYMHQRGLFHNSLTTENILFQDDSQNAAVKITYAGVTAGPPDSIPNLLSKAGWDPYRKDIYSVGMITYQLLSGGKEPPTDLDTHLVVPGSSLFLGRRWKLISVSKNAKNFVEKCFHWNSEEAFTVEQAMMHTWMTQEHPHRSDTSRSDPKKDIVVVKWNGANRSSEVMPVVSLSREQYEKEVKARKTKEEMELQEERSPIVLQEEVDDDIPVFLPMVQDSTTSSIAAVDIKDIITDETDMGNDSISDTAEADNTVLVDESALLESPPDDIANVIAPPAPIPAVETTDEVANAITSEDMSPVPFTEEEVEETPDEFLYLRDAFDEAAADNGGGVNVDALKAKLKDKYTEEEVNSWFHMEKYEDTRLLDYQVLLRKAKQNRRTIEIRRVEAAFKKIDKGKRGFVTVGNLRAVLGTDNSANIEMLIKAADTNRDGRITYENFEKVVQKWLAANESNSPVKNDNNTAENVENDVESTTR